MDRGTLLSGLAVFVFCFVVGLVFWNQKTTSEQEIEQYKLQVTRLQNLLEDKAAEEKLRKRKDSLQKADSMRSENFTGANTEVTELPYPQKFDPLDRKNFRLYGLFKDENNELSAAKLAEKFNVRADAVKSFDAEGGKWYIVPIKIAHYLRKGETAEGLARRYYKNNKKASLILDFNKRFDAETWIYIPFGE